MKKALLTISLLVPLALSALAQDTIRTFTFDDTDWASITTGTLSATDQVNGYYVGADSAHYSGYSAYQWNRAYLWNLNTSGISYTYYSHATNNDSIFGWDDNIMRMSMHTSNTSGGTGAINAYFQLPAVARPDTTQVVSVSLTQLYRCFNNDRCYIDYKVGDQWKSREVNVKGVDCQNNGWAPIHANYTMPLELGEQDSIELRVRWACNSDAGGAYGYMWVIDTLAIVSAPATNWQRQGSDDYVDGLYGTLPQGWQIPLTWYADVVNTGANDISNLTATVYSQAIGATGTATEVASTTLATLPAGDATEAYRLTIDGRQLYSEQWWTPSYFYNSDGYANASATITNNGLPTTTAGWYTAHASVGGQDYANHAYRVSEADDEGYYRWSLSRGILSSADEGYRHGLTDGFDGFHYITDEDPHWNHDGYGIMTRLTTPNTIPTDANGEPYVLRGIELVAAPNLEAEGAELTPMLFVAVQTEDGGFNFTSVSTGAANHIVTADELNTLASGTAMPGEYNTIRINFPMPIELEPATSYFVGYNLADNADFAVARDYNYYLNADGEDVNFRNDETLAPYAGLVPVGAGGVYVFSHNGGIWIGQSYSEAPMISGIVGPRPEVVMHNMYVSHNGGSVFQADGDTRIYATDTTPLQIAEGSTTTLYFVSYDNSDYASEAGVADTAMQLKQLFVNGVEISLDDYYGDDYQLVRHDAGGNYSYYHELTLYNIISDITVQAIFGPYEAECEPVSILWVSNVDSSTATLNWEANAGGTGVYYIYYQGYLLDSVESLVTTVSYNLWGLESNTNYSGFYIGSKCANGNVNTSGEFPAFTTSGYTPTNTFTITKIGNGYMGWGPASDDEAFNYLQVGTTDVSVPEGSQIVIYMYSFGAYPYLQNFIDAGLIDTNALILKSLSLDGQPINIGPNSTSGENYTLEVYQEYTGVVGFFLTVATDGNHTIVANFLEYDDTDTYTVSVNSSDASLGDVYGGGTYNAGEVATIIALPQGGVTFVGWATSAAGSIMSEYNPMQITVNNDLTLYGVFTTASLVEIHDTVTAYQYIHDTVNSIEYVHDTLYMEGTDTIYLYIHDTVYRTDTVYVGVDDVEPEAEVKLYSQNNQIVVEGAQGYDVVLYDAVGRQLAMRRDDYGLLRFEVPASGVYLVRVGQHPARRIVVMR